MDYVGHTHHYVLSRYRTNDESYSDEKTSWVMLSREGGVIRLPHEKILYRHQSRISLSLSTPNSLKDAPSFFVTSDSGTLYITTWRVIYLPTKPTEQFKSFAAPVLNFEDTHCPSGGIWGLFSAWSWVGLVRPVPGGNVPSGIPRLEIKLTFNDGDFPNFNHTYETIRDRLQHAQEVAAETGQAIPVDEPLPQYTLSDASRMSAVASSSHTTSPPAATSSPPPPQRQQQQPLDPQEPRSSAGLVSETQSPPDEPPPGYEEAQAQALGERLEETLRGAAETR